MTKDMNKCKSEYVCKPSFFIKSSLSDFYKDKKNLCDDECEFIKKYQNDDGTWNITWSWGNYLEEWSISKNWWKSDIIISNLKYLSPLTN